MHWLKVLVLPPLPLLLLAVAGLLLLRRRPRLGRGLLIAAVVLFWLLSTPLVAGLMLGSLQGAPLPAAPPPQADAIVVLSAGADTRAPEYGGASVGPMTLQRLRYAALLQRRTGLPLLVSGGQVREGVPPLSRLMQAVLQDELGVPVAMVEDRSRNTLENARLSAPILRQSGARRILLVTHAWHMPRARACFRAQGLEVIAAPTAFRGPAFEGLGSLLPSWQALRDSHLALHEWLGLLAYELFYL